jgi:rhodanese-related sulfurtransferase
MVRRDVKLSQYFWLAACLLIAMLAACTAKDDDSPRGAGPMNKTAAELAEQIQSSQAPLILDVRSKKEYAEGHIPGAVNIPHDQLDSRLSEIDAAKTHEIVVHCRSGYRAEIAAKILIEAGYSDVYDLDGHMNGWQSGGYPIERP